LLAKASCGRHDSRMKMAPGKADWPHKLADATSAEIVPWTGRGIGVRYTFPGRDQQSNPIGAEDRATLERLERAGTLTYLDEDTRRRYETMKRAGLFG
jgi:hypothetical protein